MREDVQVNLNARAELSFLQPIGASNINAVLNKFHFKTSRAIIAYNTRFQLNIL